MVFFIIILLLLPIPAFAWGPLTHIYLGNEIFFLGPLLPAGIYALIKKFRNDFLYGTLMADIIMWKKYLPDEKSSHSWDVAFSLLESAKTQQQKAFVYGYMSHLAADTVAHGLFSAGRKNVRHTFLELRSDGIIDNKYWIQARAIDKKVQVRNDLFLERALERVMFSFKTNKRIFKSMVFLAGLNHEKFSRFIDNNITLPSVYETKYIEQLHHESLDRIIDLFQNGKESEIVKKDPLGNLRHNGRFRKFWNIAPRS